MSALNESIVEDAALTWFGELGYAVGHGPQLAPGEPAAERDSFGEVVLVGRLRAAIARLNPSILEEAREEGQILLEPDPFPDFDQILPPDPAVLGIMQEQVGQLRLGLRLLGGNLPRVVQQLVLGEFQKLIQLHDPVAHRHYLALECP